MSQVRQDSYESWTYKQYLAIHKARNGVAIYYTSNVGIRAHLQDKLSQQKFDKKLALLLELESRDTDWYLKHRPDSYINDYIDKMEGDARVINELLSELFLIEYNRASKIWKAVHGDRAQQEREIEQWLRENKETEIIIRGHERGVRSLVQDAYGRTIGGGFATSIEEAMRGAYIMLELEDQA